MSKEKASGANLAGAPAPDISGLSANEPDIKRRRKASFGGDVVRLVTGTSFSQALALLVSPILTRLFAPEAFGVSALFGSITTVLGVVTCLRYEPAVMLPEEDDEAANILGLCLLASALVSILTVPIVLFGKPLVRLLKAGELESSLWLVPPAVLAAGIFLALSHWNTRTRQFGRISAARVTSSVVTSGAQLGAGFSGHATGNALIGASVAGSAVSAAVLAGRILREDGPLFRRAIRWPEMLRGARRHRRFPLYGIWSTLLNSLSWQTPTFLLSVFFSPVVVGFYALGTRLLKMPMNLVGSAIGMVFFERAATARREGTLPRIVEATFRRLVLLGLFPMLLLTFVGRDLFVVVFGPKWAEAGVYMEILSVWMFFWFVSSPLITLVSVLEKQSWGLLFNMAIFVTRLASIWIGGVLGDVRLALLLFGISGILTYGAMNLGLMAAAGVPRLVTARILISALLPFLPAAAVLAGLSALKAGALLRVGVAAAMGGLYLLHAFRKDPELRALFRRAGRKTPQLRASGTA